MDQQIEIFCCYAREDQNLLDKLKRFLVPLRRENLISGIWSDTDINPGTDWEKEIHKHLNTAQIILLLVSPDFMASDYCNSVELKQAMERYEKGQARVIPIILRPTHLKRAIFVKLQMLPTEGRPVTKWENEDDAFLDIVQGAERAIEELIKAAEERKRLRQEQARIISLFGYETGGGTKSPLWTDPITPELDEEKFQQWRDTKRAFTEEEIVGHTWIKIGSHGYIFIVRFLADKALKESSLSDPGNQWDGSWKLINGILRINIDIYELDVFANPGSSMHSGIEFMQSQSIPDAYFVLLPLQEKQVKHWPLEEVPALVERIFEQILERPANQRELIAYGSLLHRGEMSVRDVIKILGLSQEHRERFIDTETVDEGLELCYKHFLGRVIDPTGRAFYPRDVEIMGFSWLINHLVDSDEYVYDRFGEEGVPPDSITWLTVTSMYPNHLECFYRGSDSHLWHRWWYGKEWSGEDNRGGMLTSAPATISRGAKWIDCFYRGQNNHLWHRRWDGERNHWSDEEDLGGFLTSAPTVSSWGPNRLDCFYRGLDNCLWHRWWDGNWSERWSEEENLGGTLTSAPAAISWGPNRIDCFYRGQNNHLWQIWWDGKRWNSEADLGGFLTSAPTVTSWGPNRLACFVRGQDYHMWVKYWNGSTWSRWIDLGGSLTSAPAAVSWGDKRTDCFYRGKNSHLWHHWWDGSWNQEDLGSILS